MMEPEGLEGLAALFAQAEPQFREIEAEQENEYLLALEAQRTVLLHLPKEMLIQFVLGMCHDLFHAEKPCAMRVPTQEEFNMLISVLLDRLN